MTWQTVQIDAQVLLPREGEVHVWRVPLDRPVDDIAGFEKLLAEDELERAARFRFCRDRRRFVAARGVLRTLLGRYLEKPGRQIDFGYEPSGRPHLVEGRGPIFNVSHSGELALIAFSASTTVGLDIERIRDMDDASAIVEHFFSPAEIIEWHALPFAFRTRAFFDCWTRKEAYIKAVGAGLSLPLDEFEVTFGPGRPPHLTLSDSCKDKVWSLFDLPVGPDYAGALAIPGTGWQLRFMT